MINGFIDVNSFIGNVFIRDTRCSMETFLEVRKLREHLDEQAYLTDKYPAALMMVANRTSSYMS